MRHVHCTPIYTGVSHVGLPYSEVDVATERGDGEDEGGQEGESPGR